MLNFNLCCPHCGSNNDFLYGHKKSYDLQEKIKYSQIHKCSNCDKMYKVSFLFEKEITVEKGK